MCSSCCCCAGKAFCSNICECFSSICKTDKKYSIRLAYIIINLLCIIFVIISFYFIHSIFTTFSQYVNCPSESGGQSECLGAGSVYRMSFSLTCFYLILIILLLICCIPQAQKLISEGLWCLKISLIIGLFVCSFFVTNSVVNIYVEIARYTSITYLLYQSLTIIDMLYIWSHKWVTSYEKGNQLMKYLLIITSLVLYGLTITLSVLTFIWFKGCNLNTIISSINVVIIILMTIVQIMGFNPHGSLIASGGVSLYISFMTFSSQINTTNESCNRLIFDSNNRGGFYADLVISIFLNLLVFLSITLHSKNNTNETAELIGINIKQLSLAHDIQEDENLREQKDEKDEERNSGNYSKKDNALPQNNKPQDDSELKQKENQQNIIQFRIFFIVMLFISLYTSMLITNWGSPSFESSTFNLYQGSSSSYWIKIGIAWATSCIYLWTLIAPKILKNRDFS